MATTSTSDDAVQRPIFSQELFDLCIDMIGYARPTSARPDLSSLFACNLVCRSFSNRTRKHLFHTIHIYDPTHTSKDGTQPELKVLHDIMTWQGRGIAQYIQTFRFETMDEFDHALVASVFRALHGPLHGITEFEVDVHMGLSYMKQGLRQAFLDLVRSPRLRVLGIKELVVPCDILLGTHIKHLKLCAHVAPNDRLYSAKDLIANPATLMMPILESFDASIDIDFAFLKTAPVVATGHTIPAQSALAELYNLYYTVLGDDDLDTHLQPILAKVKTTVERIELRYSPMATLGPKGTFDMRELEVLTYLQLYGQPDAFEASQIIPSALDNVVKFLTSTKPPSSLKTVEIVILMTDECSLAPKAFFSSFENGPYKNWTRLDAAFCRPSSAFKSIKNVVITVHFDSHIAHLYAERGIVTDLVKMAHVELCRVLPRLYKAERLFINIAFTTITPYETWTICNLDGVMDLEACL